MADKKFNFNSNLLFLFLVPMWMNMLLRTYSWLSLLENHGVINLILNALGFKSVRLLYKTPAIILGMSYNFLPMIILPVYNSLKKINQNILEAAADLGAGHFIIFTRIILPMIMPGILSGVTMIFMPAVTSFVISSLLGGGKFMLIGNLIEHEFLRVGDWNFGSALAIILILVMLIFSGLLSLMHIKRDAGELSDGGILF
jgi:spermidine/putrescine transport system permease protein